MAGSSFARVILPAAKDGSRLLEPNQDYDLQRAEGFFCAEDTLYHTAKDGATALFHEHPPGGAAAFRNGNGDLDAQFLGDFPSSILADFHNHRRRTPPDDASGPQEEESLSEVSLGSLRARDARDWNPGWARAWGAVALVGSGAIYDTLFRRYLLERGGDSLPEGDAEALVSPARMRAHAREVFLAVKHGLEGPFRSLWFGELEAEFHPVPCALTDTDSSHEDCASIHTEGSSKEGDSRSGDSHSSDDERRSGPEEKESYLCHMVTNTTAAWVWDDRLGWIPSLY